MMGGLIGAGFAEARSFPHIPDIPRGTRVVQTRVRPPHDPAKPLRSSMASPYLYRLQSRIRLFAKGHLWLTEESFRQTGRNLDIRLGSCEGSPIPDLRGQRRSDAQVRGGQGGQSHLIPCGSSMAIH
jgi:hypothetical protein